MVYHLQKIRFPDLAVVPDLDGLDLKRIKLVFKRFFQQVAFDDRRRSPAFRLIGSQDPAVIIFPAFEGRDDDVFRGDI